MRGAYTRADEGAPEAGPSGSLSAARGTLVAASGVNCERWAAGGGGLFQGASLYGVEFVVSAVVVLRLHVAGVRGVA